MKLNLISDLAAYENISSEQHMNAVRTTANAVSGIVTGQINLRKMIRWALSATDDGAYCAAMLTDSFHTLPKNKQDTNPVRQALKDARDDELYSGTMTGKMDKETKKRVFTWTPEAAPNTGKNNGNSNPKDDSGDEPDSPEEANTETDAQEKGSIGGARFDKALAAAKSLDDRGKAELLRELWNMQSDEERASAYDEIKKDMALRNKQRRAADKKAAEAAA